MCLCVFCFFHSSVVRHVFDLLYSAHITHETGMQCELTNEVDQILLKNNGSEKKREQKRENEMKWICVQKRIVYFISYNHKITKVNTANWFWNTRHKNNIAATWELDYKSFCTWASFHTPFPQRKAWLRDVLKENTVDGLSVIHASSTRTQSKME